MPVVDGSGFLFCRFVHDFSSAHSEGFVSCKQPRFAVCKSTTSFCMEAVHRTQKT